MNRIARSLLITVSGLSLGWGLVLIEASCTRQLTVEEADAAVVTSCLLLSQALTADHPERLDQIAAQVCQPGRTRTLIENLLSRGAPSPSTEFLDLEFPAGTLSPMPLPDSLESDAGVMTRRGAP